MWKFPAWNVRILRENSGYAVIVSKVVVLGITLTAPGFPGARFAAPSLGRGTVYLNYRGRGFSQGSLAFSERLGVLLGNFLPVEE